MEDDLVPPSVFRDVAFWKKVSQEATEAIPRARRTTSLIWWPTLNLAGDELSANASGNLSRYPHPLGFESQSIVINIWSWVGTSDIVNLHSLIRNLSKITIRKIYLATTENFGRNVTEIARFAFELPGSKMAAYELAQFKSIVQSTGCWEQLFSPSSLGRSCSLAQASVASSGQLGSLHTIVGGSLIKWKEVMVVNKIGEVCIDSDLAKVLPKALGPAKIAHFLGAFTRDFNIDCLEEVSILCRETLFTSENWLICWNSQISEPDLERNWYRYMMTESSGSYGNPRYLRLCYMDHLGNTNDTGHYSWTLGDQTVLGAIGADYWTVQDHFAFSDDGGNHENIPDLLDEGDFGVESWVPYVDKARYGYEYTEDDGMHENPYIGYVSHDPGFGNDYTSYWEHHGMYEEPARGYNICWGLGADYVSYVQVPASIEIGSDENHGGCYEGSSGYQEDFGDYVKDYGVCEGQYEGYEHEGVGYEEGFGGYGEEYGGCDDEDYGDDNGDYYYD